jgi:hypothetical protein
MSYEQALAHRLRPDTITYNFAMYTEYMDASKDLAPNQTITFEDDVEEWARMGVEVTQVKRTMHRLGDSNEVIEVYVCVNPYEITVEISKTDVVTGKFTKLTDEWYGNPKGLKRICKEVVTDYGY